MSLKAPVSIGEEFALRAFTNGTLPASPAGRLEFVHTLLHGFPICDDFGEPTGEYTEPYITIEDAQRLLDGMK